MQIAAIDLGISNWDVAARVDGALHHWLRPATGQPDAQRIAALLAEGGVTLTQLTRLAITGGRQRGLPAQLAGCELVRVAEMEAIGRGGLALAGEPSAALVVSAGSGTAMVAARKGHSRHVTGSAVGGGTLLGLAHLLLATTDPSSINTLAEQGDSGAADLVLSDVVDGAVGRLPPDATAVNFGRLASQSLDLRREDLAAALVTLVCQVIAVIAINAARAEQLEQIVVVGHLTDLSSVRAAIARVGNFYGTELLLPADAGRATALGALLVAE